MKPSAVICILLLLLCLTIPAQAEEYDPWAPKEIFLFGMPYLGSSVSERNKGLIPEVLKAVYEPIGIEFRHRELPYVRAIEELKLGDIHCSLDVKARNRGFAQGKYILGTYKMTVAYLRKTGFKGLASLNGQRVAYLHGFGIKEMLKLDFTPQQIFDLSSGFHMLDRNTVGYFIGDYRLLHEALEDSKLPSVEFEFTTIKALPVCPIFANTDEGKRYREIYDRRMAKIIKNGDLDFYLRKAGIEEERIRAIHELNAPSTK
ncbi:hypothetical protein [Pseudodesulfovibrio sp. zrk46]|uniref:hypothetical protein n=1 Tax=Pseudodesulfovibrio sp. zrk46 TaxID=2725288 RepID=UPI00144999FA|nr:hypothetical protein [Pseudodesulfovibrio sp. zrk46]QJB55636.1 hypothetical protein HFN16_04145 [Pseudodesulfovibrio sp. zrk46]